MVIISHKHKFIFLKTRKVAGTSLEVALSRFCGDKDVITPIYPEDEAMREKKNPGSGCKNYKKSLTDFISLWAIAVCIAIPLALGLVNGLICNAVFLVCMSLAPHLGFFHSSYQTLGLVGAFKRAHNRFVKSQRLMVKFYNHIPAKEVKALVPEEFKNYYKISVARNPYDLLISRYFWAKGKGVLKDGVSFKEYVMQQDPKDMNPNQKVTHIDGKSVVDYFIDFEKIPECLEELGEKLNIPELASAIEGVNCKGGLRPDDATTAKMFEDFPEGVELVQKTFRDEIKARGYTWK